MDVPRGLFTFELVPIIKEIVKSHFVALDLELSGIPVKQHILDGKQGQRTKGNNTGGSNKPNLQEHYEEVKKAAKQFQILQVGLTVVEESEDGQYIVRPYNFYISPVPESRLRLERSWSFSSGAVQFLLKHNFQFDKPYTIGIPYISRGEERAIRAVWAEADKSLEDIPDIEVRPGDEPFVQAVRDTIGNWVKEPKKSKDAWLNLPPPAGSSSPFPHSKPLNGWQRRMIYQITKKEFPELVAQSRNGGAFMQLQERTEEAQGSKKKAEKEMFRERDLANATEFRWIVEALVGGDISNMPLNLFSAPLSGTERNKATESQLKGMVKSLQKKVTEHRTVLVGHNIFLDLVNFYQCFIDELPDTVEEFQTAIHQLFPLVIDTKWLASYKANSFDATNLEDVEFDLRGQKKPKIKIAEGFDKYKFNEQYHEAAYDSYLTAAVAVKLSAKRKSEGAENTKSLLAFGVNPPDALLEDIGSTAPESSPPSKQSDLLSKPVPSEPSAEPSATNETVSKVGVPHKTDGVSDDTEKVRKTLGQTTISESKAKKRVKGAIGNVISKVKPTNKKESQNRFAGLMDAEEMDDDGDEVDADDNEDERKALQLQKIMRGEMMPRWNDESFWKVFGNRLRVNPSAEGVCSLAP